MIIENFHSDIGWYDILGIGKWSSLKSGRASYPDIDDALNNLTWTKNGIDLSIFNSILNELLKEVK